VSNIVNSVLAPVGLRIARVEPSDGPPPTDDSGLTSWDEQFLRWITEAREQGIDPNDIGDHEWQTDLLDAALATHYLPHLSARSTVLELGPGTGRLTRHLVRHAARTIAVDKSPVVCDWIRSYLPDVAMHHIVDAAVPMMDDGSVDAVFAHGVMEHLELDELFWFVRDFTRVTRPGGAIVFNFDTPTTHGGMDHVRTTGSPASPSEFRFHAPEAISAVADAVGCRCEISLNDTRIAFATLTVPA
jgi:SAM-dependent methyltransferase